MSILDEIQEDILEAFLEEDSPFLPSSIVPVVEASWEDKPIANPIPCRCFRDNFTYQERATMQINERNVKLMILQRNDAGATIKVGTGDTVHHPEGSFVVVTPLEQDPAQATWTMEARPVSHG